ncbi:hypothetical protein LC082_06475 [Microbacterium esteraromaticum]|uniref:hypothetical protein n=1 Tax=Microbacterium esteraromaticum TaxID=57043 RepID=UPI001CD6506D|nr:hypothetical protein [Microbacterium esteraromaticum]MCA1306537.1 hypothetical protein [Microbacterium esteraromaticum]
MRNADAPSPWKAYRESIGDRSPLFAEIASVWGVADALYPGSYVDLSPSSAIRSVTYVDTDRRAAGYFRDADRVQADLADAASGMGHVVEFIGSDYTKPLPLSDGRFDLLISLYAGPVWDSCRRYVKPDGLLLANTSHGDASIAALDPDLQLIAAVHHRAGRYRLDTQDLHTYLVPKVGDAANAERIRDSGRGIAYTRSAYAYVFRRLSRRGSVQP